MATSRLVIITGVSGSGKSTALNALEDLGFFCVDNLPAPLIHPFVDFLESLTAGSENSNEPTVLPTAEGSPFDAASRYRNTALLIDCRSSDALPPIQQALKRLREKNTDVSLLFFDCLDDVVVRRFRETRRPHPLLNEISAGLGDTSEPAETMIEALRQERKLLGGLRQEADRIIDTSNCSPHDLRRLVETYIGSDAPQEAKLEITLMSFGFKYGMPNSADLIVDVRFLPNPHFVPELRELSGLDQPVREYVFESQETQGFLDRYLELLNYLVPRYQAEGKRYLTVGVGCTGGKHRSVALSTAIASELKKQSVRVRIRHRDIERA